MFSYIKKLQYPINIKNPDPRAASIIISQYGGRMGNWVPVCAICPSGILCRIRS
mgnify:CR=1 FL=1